MNKILDYIPEIVGGLIGLAIVFGVMSCVMGSEAAIQTIAYEASGESYEGQVAVANTIKTRMEKRNQTAEQVVKAPYQFSCWCPKTGKPTQRRKLSKREIDTARRAWEEAKVWQYDHYAHVSVDNYWTKTRVEEVVIGRHRFMRLR